MKTNAKKPATKSAARPTFDLIRKPPAPPGHPLARAKPEERVHPAGRKAKRKRRDGDGSH